MGSDPGNISAGAGDSAQRYAARMVYLTEEDDGNLFGGAVPEPMGRTLKPPVLFMSRRQARADSALCAVREVHRKQQEIVGGLSSFCMRTPPRQARRRYFKHHACDSSFLNTEAVVSTLIVECAGKSSRKGHDRALFLSSCSTEKPVQHFEATHLIATRYVTK